MRVPTSSSSSGQTAPPVGGPPAPRRSRVIWLQNRPDHYFVQMLDDLNAQDLFEYFGVFLCAPPDGSALLEIPQRSPHVFLGIATDGEGHRLRPDALDLLRKLDFQAAIVGGYDSRLKVQVIKWCRRAGRPVALVADSNLRSERGTRPRDLLRRFLKRVFLRHVIRRVDRIIPFNRFGVAYWRYYGCAADKIVRSTYFCDLREIAAAVASERAEVLARYNFNTNQKIIFTAARLVPQKALDLMVHAFGRSGLAQRGWIWAIAGDGPLRDQLRAAAGPLNNQILRFLGVVKPRDVPALARHSDLFVLPSRYEPHGIVVAEAMAVGTPVIASDVCGAAGDLVARGKTGWIFRNGNEESLLRVLQRATSDQINLADRRNDCRLAFENWYQRYSPLRVIPAVMAELLAAGQMLRARPDSPEKLSPPAAADRQAPDRVS